MNPETPSEEDELTAADESADEAHAESDEAEADSTGENTTGEDENPSDEVSADDVEGAEGDDNIRDITVDELVSELELDLISWSPVHLGTVPRDFEHRVYIDHGADTIKDWYRATRLNTEAMTAPTLEEAHQLAAEGAEEDWLAEYLQEATGVYNTIWLGTESNLVGEPYNYGRWELDRGTNDDGENVHILRYDVLTTYVFDADNGPSWARLAEHYIYEWTDEPDPQTNIYLGGRSTYGDVCIWADEQRLAPIDAPLDYLLEHGQRAPEELLDTDSASRSLEEALEDADC